MTSRKSWKSNRIPFLAPMMNLIISGTCMKRRKMIWNVSSTVKQSILSGLMSVELLWQQNAPPWDCARTLPSQSSLTTRSGDSRIRRHQQIIRAAKKLQSGPQQLRGCLIMLGLPLWGIISMGLPYWPCNGKILKILVWPRWGHWLSY